MSVSNTIRQLLQDQENTPVYVSQPRELEDAILKGRRHIVITAHLDMTSMPLRSTSICPDGCESPLPEIRETWSIRVCYLTSTGQPTAELLAVSQLIPSEPPNTKVCMEESAPRQPITALACVCKHVEW